MPNRTEENSRRIETDPVPSSATWQGLNSHNSQRDVNYTTRMGTPPLRYFSDFGSDVFFGER